MSVLTTRESAGRRRIPGPAVILVAFLLLAAIPVFRGSTGRTDRDGDGPQVSPAAPRDGGWFTGNSGQWGDETLFSAGTDFGYVWLARDGIKYDIRTAQGAGNHMLNLSFVGGGAEPVGQDRLGHASGFLRRGDPGPRVISAGNYRSVRYSGVWPDIDLIYRMDGTGLKYEFHVGAAGRVEDIGIRVEGANLHAEGAELEMIWPGGGLVDTGLLVVSAVSGRELRAGFSVSGDVYGFHVEGRLPGEPIIIDPLVYSSVLGGAEADYGYAVAVDRDGCAHIAGSTWSRDFPATSGSFQGGINDAFLMKMAPDGSGPLYSLFLGGSGSDEAWGLAVDPDGYAYVTGLTTSEDFPTTEGAYMVSRTGGWSDVFVVRVSPDGSRVEYSTLMGGNGSDWGFDIAVDGTGHALVTGTTESPDFPITPGAYERRGDGNSDIFVFRLSPDGGSLVYSCVIGGERTDEAYGIAVDAAGRAHVTGETLSPDFPTTPGAYQRTHYGDYDAFVLKLSPDGSRLEYSTLVGGGGRDSGYGIALDGAGSAHITGITSSRDFQVTHGAYGRTLSSENGDAFVLKLSPDGSRAEYSTFIGGDSADTGRAIAVDRGGRAHVCGSTRSSDFPTTAGAHSRSKRGTWDAFALRLSPGGSRLEYSTLLGGSSADYGQGIAVDRRGRVYVAGETGSGNFPTTSGAYHGGPGGGRSDAFVLVLDMDREPEAGGWWPLPGMAAPAVLAVLSSSAFITVRYPGPFRGKKR